MFEAEAGDIDGHVIVVAQVAVEAAAIDAEFLVPLLVSVLGFSLIFGGVVLARMRALLGDIQAEARLRRRASERA